MSEEMFPAIAKNQREKARLESYIREKHGNDEMNRLFARAFFEILAPSKSATDRQEKLERLCNRLNFSSDRNIARDVANLFE